MTSPSQFGASKIIIITFSFLISSPVFMACLGFISYQGDKNIFLMPVAICLPLAFVLGLVLYSFSKTKTHEYLGLFFMLWLQAISIVAFGVVF